MNVFVGHELDEQQPLLEQAAELIDTLPALDLAARAAFRNELNDIQGEFIVREFAKVHTQEFDESIRAEFFGADLRTRQLRRTFFNGSPCVASAFTSWRPTK